MREVNEKLVDIYRDVINVASDIEREGNEYQGDLIEEIASKISELRLSVMKDIRLEKTLREELTDEVTNALLEVVADTQQPFKEVLEEARIVYDDRIVEVKKRERFQNLFKGGKR